MGESACLMQPFSYTAPERDSVSGLGQSVSFGRFMSEKLEWEKWSAFTTTQNRYVAEAERYSRPGSVAQKKAFFEAHYKKLAAARKAAAEEEEALLLLQQQQQNNLNNSKPVTEEPEKTKLPVQEDDGFVSKLDQEDGFVSKSDLETPRMSSDAKMKLLAEKVTKFGNRKSDDEKENHEKKKVKSEITTEKKKVESGIKTEKKKVESEIKAEKKKTPIIIKKKSKDSQPTMSSSSSSNTKPRVSKCDSTQKTPSRNKRNSYNFTPAKEFNRLVSIIKKIDGSTRASSSNKPTKELKTPLRTPSNKVSAKGIVEDDSLSTPLSSSRRGKVAPDSSAKTGRGRRWSFLSTEKSRTPSCFTPFGLRTEERAERRKKKLEEKFKDMENPKVTIVEEEEKKEESKLQQRLCFKAKPLPNFYKRRPKSTDQTKKALLY